MAKRKRNPLAEGLMSAGIGVLNFQLSSMTRKQLEDADLRKEQRIAAIRAQQDEVNHQRTLERDSLQNQAADGRLDKQQAQQLEVLERNQDQQVKLEGMRHANASALQGAQISASDRRLDKELAARQTSEGAGKGFLGDDGNWYPVGASLPDGVQSVAGIGVSYAPPASRTAARPGLMGGAPGANGAGSAPAKPTLVWDPQQGKLVPAK